MSLMNRVSMLSGMRAYVRLTRTTYCDGATPNRITSAQVMRNAMSRAVPPPKWRFPCAATVVSDDGEGACEGILKVNVPGTRRSYITHAASGDPRVPGSRDRSRVRGRRGALWRGGGPP